MQLRQVLMFLGSQAPLQVAGHLAQVLSAFKAKPGAQAVQTVGLVH